MKLGFIIAFVLCQLPLPTGGADEILQKGDLSVNILFWLVGILLTVIVYLYFRIEKLTKEIADLKDNQIKNLEQKLMRYENK